MQELNDFFSMGAPRVTVARPIAERTQNLDHIVVKPPPKRREPTGTEYAAEYQRAEVEQLIKTFSNSTRLKSESPSTSTAAAADMDELEHDQCDASDHRGLRPDDIYDRYNFKYKLPQLPISHSHRTILETIAKRPVCVLQGATGCGKTTQVPQMILNEAYENRQYCNIVVTQPRRIAAQTIAGRVCQERNWKIGDVVGYQVGLQTNSSDDTRILYCTTGVLLEKLVKTKTMANYTHVILDEVHERNQDMDFLFIVVRRLLATNSPNVRVILMSATIEAPLFAKYFSMPMGNVMEPAPIINVENLKRNYILKEYFLEHLSRMKVGLTINYEEAPDIDPSIYNLAMKLIIICGRLDESEESSKGQYRAILLFLPGIYEIETMYKYIKEYLASETKEKRDSFLILTLHSTVTIDEQRKAFKVPEHGKRKIILATNIAESSITVPDVKYVIDFCLTKYLVTDPNTNFTSLKLDWASKNNCRQRAGRAGRVMDGRVYRLVNEWYYTQCMKESATPEMLRCPLENVVLRSKMLDMGPPHAILALAMDQPQRSAIDNTILILKEVGALLNSVNGIPQKHDGDITFIGRVMAALPVAIQISRLIIFGYCFSVLEDCIIIGAGLTVKSIFLHPVLERFNGYVAKLAWSDGSGSDLFAILRAYKAWRAKKEQNFFLGDSTEDQWANRYKLHIKSLNEMSNQIDELKGRLQRLGIQENRGVQRATWTQAEHAFILKVVIAGAFYPNYFVRSSFHEEYRDRDAFYALNGRDPCTTVYYKGLDRKYIGELYVGAIKDLLKDCTSDKRNMVVSFDEGSDKVFVTFRQNGQLYTKDKSKDAETGCVESLPGKIAINVYKAAKMHKLKMPSTIRVMEQSVAVQYAENAGLGIWDLGKWQPKPIFVHNKDLISIPRTNVRFVNGRITYCHDMDEFWFQSNDEITMLQNIYDELNQPNAVIEPFEDVADIKPGQMLAAPTNEGYQRACVEYMIKSSEQTLFKVCFIDIGTYGTIEFSELRQLRGISAQFKDVPPRVFKCRLAQIVPSSLSNSNSWSEKSVKFFKRCIEGNEIRAEIYSVVNAITNVILYINNDNLNDSLIAKGFAQISEENYMSKTDHELRMRRQSNHGLNLKQDDLSDEIVKMLSLDHQENLAQPHPSVLSKQVKLQGPLSPLECKVYIAMQSGFSKMTTIESESVNSVLLDAGQDSHEKLMVAATITETSNGASLTARQTTLMPNIPGFAAIMALIFCPYTEMVRDKIHSRYVAILTGLGMDKETRKPIFEDHDILLSLDVNISLDDLTLINKIRFSLDSMLHTTLGQERPNISESERKTFTLKIRDYILDLMSKDRKLQAMQHEPLRWGMMNPKDILPHKNIFGDRSIFPPHSCLRLKSEDSPELLDHYAELAKNCKELHSISEYAQFPVRTIKCKLCSDEFSSVSTLRLHLRSRLHRDRENTIHYRLNEE